MLIIVNYVNPLVIGDSLKLTQTMTNYLFKMAVQTR